MEVQKPTIDYTIPIGKINVQMQGALMQMALLTPSSFSKVSDILTMTLAEVEAKCQDKEFMVFNLTDSITMHHENFKLRDAVQFVSNFPDKYKKQGYYRDNKWNKMNPLHVRLAIKPILC